MSVSLRMKTSMIMTKANEVTRCCAYGSFRYDQFGVSSGFFLTEVCTRGVITSSHEHMQGHEHIVIAKDSVEEIDIGI